MKIFLSMVAGAIFSSLYVYPKTDWWFWTAAWICITCVGLIKVI